MKSTPDVGMFWAHFMAVFGQVSVAMSILQFISTLAILYTVTISKYHIPPWAFVSSLVGLLVVAVGFIIKWGIPGYYRFFNNRSKSDQMARDICLIKRKLGIDD